MAVIGTLSAGIRRQRIQVRLIAYGAAAALLITSALAGYLDRPGFPVGIAVVGLLFAIPASRLRTFMFWLAVTFDAVAVLALALISDSLLLGGLAIAVAALTLSIGKAPSTIVPVGVVSMLAIVALLLMEKGIVPVPTAIPTLESPADTVAALTMSTVIAIAGIVGVRRLLAMYGLAASRVEESTRRWWRFMEQSNDPMLVTVDGVVARANPAAESLIGRPSPDLQGRPLHELVADQSRVVRPDGTEREVDVVTAPLAIEGRLSEVVFVKDVTERLRERRDLERTVRETDQFVATVSHEVRTPLTAVVGLSSLVDEAWDELDDDEMREMVRLIASQSREVSAIIEDLLVAARGGTVGLRVTSERVHLDNEAALVVQSLLPGSSPIDTTGHAAAVADAGRVRQIIRNLVTNALRYGGPEISVAIGMRGSMAGLEVSDSGNAIPSELRERIFEPFARAHEDGPVESVGLGLSVSRQLAELMGGSLTYEHSGGRSRFLLLLPAAS